MATREEPKHESSPQDAEFDATDGGWDPYVTSLLLGTTGLKAAPAEGEDDGVPVMSFSRVQEKRGR